MIPVLATSNELFAPGLCVALHSLVANAGGARFEIHVIDGGIADDSWKRIEESLGGAPGTRLVRLRPELARFEGLRRDFGGSVMTYARLLAPELFEVPRLLYVDSDLLFRRDMGEVWEAQLGDHLVAAARDTLIGVLGNESADCEALGLDPRAPYFNAGLLMIDLDAWRVERISERTLAYLSENQERCPYWDQSALNVVLHGRWAQLKPEWNLFALHVDDAPQGVDPEHANLHFVGPEKPWFHGCEEVLGAESFWSALDRTAFRGWRPTRFTKLACATRDSFARIEDRGDEAVLHATDAWVALPASRKRDALLGVSRHLAESGVELRRLRVVDADERTVVEAKLQ